MKKTFKYLQTGDKVLVCDCDPDDSALFPIHFKVDQIKRTGYSSGSALFYTESGIYGTAYDLDGIKVWVGDSLVWTDVSKGIEYYWERLDYLGKRNPRPQGCSEIELLVAAEKLRRLEDEVADI